MAALSSSDKISVIPCTGKNILERMTGSLLIMMLVPFEQLYQCES